MSGVPLVINDVADAVDLSIQHFWLKEQSDVKEYHKSFYTTEMTEDYYVKDSSLSTVNSYGKRVESERSTAASPFQGFDKTYTQARYDGMIKISQDMWKFGIKRRKLEGLVMSWKRRSMEIKEKVLTGPLVNAVSTSYTDTNGSTNFTVTNTGGDGLAPFTASHTREDGGTNWSNLITLGATDNPDFDYDAWKAAITDAQAIKDPTGGELDVTPDTLICKKGSSVHFRAMEILGAIKKNEIPGSADNDGSGVMAFKIIALPHLTSDTGWWAMDSSMKSLMYGLQVKQSQPLTLLPQDVDYENGEIRYRLEEYYDFGFNDMRCMLYSDGTNA